MKFKGAWLACLIFIFLSSCQYSSPPKQSDRYYQRVDEVYALWNFYRYLYIENGRVVSLDENGITTSEGQGYALLRSVWADDPGTFQQVWQWTQQNLQNRDNGLFAWKWKDQVLDAHSATDADTDIALALILASRRFSRPDYQQDALHILDAIWQHDVLTAGNRPVIVSGDWSQAEDYPTLHVAYLAPYAYEVFAGVDTNHPWRSLVDSSYEILRWIYFDQHCELPPDVIFIDRQTGQFYLTQPKTGQTGSFSYDSFPIFWRVAQDTEWFSHRESRMGRDLGLLLEKNTFDWLRDHFHLATPDVSAPPNVDVIMQEWSLRQKMLEFFVREWGEKGRFLDHYTVYGQPLSNQEGLALYASVHALALRENKSLADEIWKNKLSDLWHDALTVKQKTTYYLHNWLWFDQAFELHLTKRYDEFLSFLRPFDFAGFSASFPWQGFELMICFFFLARYGRIFKLLFLATAFALSVRYLSWRALHTLNFIEPAGPVISIALWLTETYCFVTMVLLFVQVGLGSKKKEPIAAPPDFSPSVDIFIPIYSEPLEILERTLIGATNIDYPNKTIYVCDDSHQDSVAALAARYGARYIRGPKHHAKAGNLNNALPQSSGELILVFDTDHIPLSAFLNETVPYFADPKIGFIQTPHHFYNEDIFQRAFRLGSEIPNEQDMFHHAIQGGRDSWGGSFFVGSGAIFRRRAIEEVGGFKLMSITEDIHTSQYLHAAGWQCAFVNKDLAVGLSAETLSSYIIQRRRWMLGALQIFFRDNPLFHWRLKGRYALGYVASLSYFFFPLYRFVIWATPMYYLLFHWHPILTEVSTLLAYLIPYVVSIPLISVVLVPGWPRLLWGELYEAIVTAPLLFSMLSLLIPKNLGFKVTPKGVTSDERHFDWRSAWLTVGVTLITAIALVKGLIEFFYYGIEKDAYFFNLGWGFIIFLVLSASLLIAWERPQRRTNNRLRHALPFQLRAEHFFFKGHTRDISLSGMSFTTHRRESLPYTMVLELDRSIVLEAHLVYCEEINPRTFRYGWSFVNVSADVYRELVLRLFTQEPAWGHAHEKRVQSTLGMSLLLFKGIANYFKPLKSTRRRAFRRKISGRTQLQLSSRRKKVSLKNWSADGVGIRSFGWSIPKDETGTLIMKNQEAYAVRIAYARSTWPWVWNAGLAKQKNGRLNNNNAVVAYAGASDETMPRTPR